MMVDEDAWFRIPSHLYFLKGYSAELEASLNWSPMDHFLQFFCQKMYKYMNLILSVLFKGVVHIIVSQVY